MGLLHNPKPLPVPSLDSPSDRFLFPPRQPDRRKRARPVAVDLRRALRRREDIEPAKS